MSRTPSPWSLDTPTLLAAGPLTHTCAVTVTTQDGDTIPVPVIDGSVSWDETRAPRVELTLSTHLIPDPALVDRIDPRKLTRVQLVTGYTRPDGTTDTHLMADLGLRSKSRSRPDDTLTLSAASDEAILIDLGPAATLTVSVPSTIAGCVKLIRDALPAAPVVTQGISGPAINTSENDQDRWDVLADYADRLSAVVYDNGLRTWFVQPRPNAAPTTPAHTIADGATGTMVEVSEDIDRDAGYGNAAFLVYEWTDPANNSKRVMAYKTATGPYAPVTGNTRILRIPREVYATQATADLTAQSLANRIVTRGRTYTVTAPSAYWLRPGDTINVSESGRPTVSVLVASISFDLRTGLMSVAGREPVEGMWDQQPDGLTWDDVPDDQTWDTYVGG